MPTNILRDIHTDNSGLEPCIHNFRRNINVSNRHSQLFFVFIRVSFPICLNSASHGCLYSASHGCLFCASHVDSWKKEITLEVSLVELQSSFKCRQIVNHNHDPTLVLWGRRRRHLLNQYSLKLSKISQAIINVYKFTIVTMICHKILFLMFKYNTSIHLTLVSICSCAIIVKID